MGKALPTVEPGHGTPVYRTAPRIRVQAIVEQAIDYAVSQYPDTVHELSPEMIREVIKTTDKIDANTWKNPGSCGCPLTAAGRVDCRPGGRGGVAGIRYVFFSRYDRLMRDEFSTSGNPLLVTLTD